MNRTAFHSLLCCFTVCSIVQAQQAPAKPNKESVGVIRRVTLYRDRALVTREIPVPAGDKLRAVTVPDLPELVVADSVYADGDEHIVIRAVRVSPRPVVESNREDVKLFEKQLHDLTQKRAEVQNSLEVVAKNILLLSQLVNFSIENGKADLNRGVLNAETLTKLTTFSMSQRHELAAAQLQHRQQLNELDSQIQQLQWKHSQATTGQHTANYQAKIFIEADQDQAGTVRLSYLVTGCGWSPQYTVRGEIGKESSHFDTAQWSSR